MKNRLARCGLFVGFVLLAGCAGMQTSAPPAGVAKLGWESRREALLARAGFEIEGRAAVQKGSEGGSLKFRWREDAAHTALRLVAPMAQGTIALERGPDGVSLLGADGQRQTADSLETLMTAQLKWSFPVAGARFWVRGVPDPATKVDYLGLDDAGRLRDLTQAGWRISVLEYREQGPDTVPRRLLLSAGDLQLRLVIDRWEWL